MSGTIYVILISYRDLIETNIMEYRYFMHAVRQCAFQIKLFPSLLHYNCYYLGSYLIKIVLLNCATRGNIKKKSSDVQRDYIVCIYPYTEK